jgi:hypothetical protein
MKSPSFKVADAFRFASAHGLQAEAAQIQSMEVHPTFKAPNVVRKGYLVKHGHDILYAGGELPRLTWSIDTRQEKIFLRNGILCKNPADLKESLGCDSLITVHRFSRMLCISPGWRRPCAPITLWL